MSFRLEVFVEDFDGSNPASGVSGSHQFNVTAPSGERILWSKMNPDPIGNNPPYAHSWLEVSSQSLDSSYRIDQVSFIIPADNEEHAVYVMFYTI